MGDPYVPLPIRASEPRLPIALTREAAKWTSIKKTAALHLADPVTHVSFSPRAPFELAAAHGFSVSLMNPHDGHVRKTLTRFRDHAYSPSYKQEGRLLVAGCGDGSAQVFDTAHRSVLKTFKGHKGAVRTARFSNDGLHVVTGSDDNTVRLWDLPTATSLIKLTDATDYVRSQSSSPASQHVWMTGSADRNARLYDLRTQKCIFTLEHGYQVDGVFILPGGARAVTLGGPEVKVWDFFSGGRMTSRLSCHAKAVTCGAVDVQGQKFATAGLDGYMKFHDLASFETKGILSFGSQILSIGISEDGKRFAAGMVDGTVEIRVGEKLANRAVRAFPKDPFAEREFEGWGRGYVKLNEDRSAPFPGSKRYFNRGAGAVPSDRDVLFEVIPKQKLKDYDESLKKFRLGEAFDLAMETNRPAVVVAVVDDLGRRGSLKGALCGRTMENLSSVLGMIRRNIRNPRYTDRLTYLLNIILDMYAGDFGQCRKADQELRSILGQVKAEKQAGQALTMMRGAAEAVLTASSIASLP